MMDNLRAASFCCATIANVFSYIAYLGCVDTHDTKLQPSLFVPSEYDSARSSQETNVQFLISPSQSGPPQIPAPDPPVRRHCHEGQLRAPSAHHPPGSAGAAIGREIAERIAVAHQIDIATQQLRRAITSEVRNYLDRQKAGILEKGERDGEVVWWVA
jgi:hypothetical protein